MALFYRLRRSVALIICPEMGVEARLKASRNPAEFYASEKVQHDKARAAFVLAARDLPKRSGQFVQVHDKLSCDCCFNRTGSVAISDAPDEHCNLRGFSGTDPVDRQNGTLKCEIQNDRSGLKPQNAVLKMLHPILHPVVGASDGRGHPDLTQAENAVGRGGAFFAWARSLTPDDVGGAVVLFGLLFAVLGVGGW